MQRPEGLVVRLFSSLFRHVISMWCLVTSLSHLTNDGSLLKGTLSILSHVYDKYLPVYI